MNFCIVIARKLSGNQIEFKSYQFSLQCFSSAAAVDDNKTSRSLLFENGVGYPSIHSLIENVIKRNGFSDVENMKCWFVVCFCEYLI